MHNPYVSLTAEFNAGRLRAVLSSGQAVVLHRLAVTSKDGDWIVREDGEATQHVLRVLESHGARYRFGAPLDVRWLAGGWSSHFEFRTGELRLRTDFVARPPRIDAQELARIWDEATVADPPVVGLELLAAIKKTDREKDYAVVGELARRMESPRARILHSRSSRDLMDLAAQHPALFDELRAARPALESVARGRDAIDEALDRERRALMRVNELRLEGYRVAARRWAALWPDVQREIDGLSLVAAHAIVAARADGVLPRSPSPGDVP